MSCNSDGDNRMIYLLCFLIGGVICAFAQIIMDKFKLMPIHVTCLYVVLGSLFTVSRLYQRLVEFSGFGAGLPISSFGASLTQAAIDKANDIGYLGIFSGMFEKTSPGIIFVIVLSFALAIISKPKG